MTDQTKYKEETEKLHDSLKNYMRKYSFMSGSRMLQSPADLLLSQLRMCMEIVRTDEENSAEERRDGMC